MPTDSQRRRAAATRRFFEGRLWPAISVIVVAALLIEGEVGTAILCAVVYVVIHLAYACIRREERIISRERAHVLAMQHEADQGQPGIPRSLH
jgi:hypothetical protein